MAASTLSNFIPFLSSTAPPPPLPKSPPPAHLSLCLTSSSNKSRGCFSAPLAATPEHQQVLAVVNPALAHANTLFFSGYNVQVVVEDNEPEERLLNRFRREVMRAGIIQECKRRRFFENKQEEAKRRVRDAAKRNRRRRGPQSRFIPQNKSDSPEGTKKHEDDNDNWDLPEADVPYLN